MARDVFEIKVKSYNNETIYRAFIFKRGCITLGHAFKICPEMVKTESIVEQFKDKWSSHILFPALTIEKDRLDELCKDISGFSWFMDEDDNQYYPICDSREIAEFITKMIYDVHIKCLAERKAKGKEE